MSERDVTASFAATLVDEWARAGVTDAVVAPGSRSAPLALALVRDGRVHVRVVLDERSAAFGALGLGLASGRPAVLLCTSGTAAANFHPAVVEASYARVPLLVCTADRPPELRDTGAGQSIDQHRLYGDAVRWFCDPGAPSDEPGCGAMWRALASRAIAETLGPPSGPVHLNLAFREPLLPTGAAHVEVPGRLDGRPWTRSAPVSRGPSVADVRGLADLVRAHPRGLLVAGWGAGVAPTTAARFATAAGWPVLADPISQLRTGKLAISTYEALLRAPGFGTAHTPDLVVRVGAALTSKVATEWLDASIPQILIDPDGAWLDPTHAAHMRLAADADTLLDGVAEALRSPRHEMKPWLADWLDIERSARAAIDGVLDSRLANGDGDHYLCEGQVARDVASALPEGATLVVASSLPVRALEWCMAPRDGLRVLANRGANGIDGFVSTVLGVAHSNAPAPTVGLCGDLSFLHDTNGLLGADQIGEHCRATIVVLDNDGGGIFSYLPPSELPEFERLFATPHHLDLVEIARAHGAHAERVDDRHTLGEVLISPHRLLSTKLRVFVVPVDRHSAIAHHRALWEAVAAVVSERI
ncbi:MAG: 2-succinyl-5-enolpyruvyl-6-hydroxy-3-cyclohexene-1-carboxylic-acid synthase [Acidimicrobiia bacterium]